MPLTALVGRLQQAPLTGEVLQRSQRPERLAPVPLRRRDLLEQCDQLLRNLQWDAQRGRQLLEQHFQLSRRKQLSDEQLLQFNMLLEEEMITAATP